MKSIAFDVMMLMVGAVDANEYCDYNNGHYIEITDGEVEEGEEVEYFDFQTGGYRWGEVYGVNEDGDVELVEYATGRIRYLWAQ